MTHTDIMSQDDSAVFVGGRASFDLGQDPVPREPGSRGPSKAFTTSLNVEFSQVAGTGEQALGPGQAVVFGGEVFNGPADLVVGLDLTQVQLDLRATTPTSSGFAAELLCGFEYASVDLQVRRASLAPLTLAERQIGSFGPILGFGVSWQPSDWVRLSADGRVGFGFSSEVDQTEVSTTNLGVTFAPERTLALYIGWRETTYKVVGGGNLVSDVDFDLSGPMISLVARF